VSGLILNWGSWLKRRGREYSAKISARGPHPET
jgi:hypothetical protein